MFVGSWNVNSLKVRLPQVLAWLEDNPMTLLGLQETKLKDTDYPTAEFARAGYQSLFCGQPTYNGVAVLYQGTQPFELIANALPGFNDEQKRVLCAAADDLCFLNLYVPNGSEVGSDKYAYKLDWLAALNNWIGQLLKDFPRLVVVGDFNVAPDDRDVHDPAAWHEKILCSTPEREALRKICAQGLHDSFRLFDQPEGEFSWWDYRAAGFRRNRGLRIDHILVSDALAGQCQCSLIDREPRRNERPSDHAPVLAEFAS